MQLCFVLLTPVLLSCLDGAHLLLGEHPVKGWATKWSPGLVNFVLAASTCLKYSHNLGTTFLPSPVDGPRAGGGVVLVGGPGQLVVAQVLGPVADVAHPALVVEHVCESGHLTHFFRTD